MNVDQILDSVINDIDDGLIACEKHKNSSTPNEGVSIILNHIKTNLLIAQREFLRGNIK